jgi:hypothetical protein
VSIRAPGPAPVEAMRARLVHLLAQEGTATEPDGRLNLLPVARLQDAVLPQIPAGVLRVLANLAEAGVPLDILTMPEKELRTTGETLYGRAGGSQIVRARTLSSGAAGVQVVSALMRAVDGGTVSVEDLNLFLGLFAVAPETIQRAMDELAGTEGSTVTLSDTVYRLVAGRLVAESTRKDDESSGLWIKTAAIAALLVLLAIAVIRFG